MGKLKMNLKNPDSSEVPKNVDYGYCGNMCCVVKLHWQALRALGVWLPEHPWEMQLGFKVDFPHHSGLKHGHEQRLLE